MSERENKTFVATDLQKLMLFAANKQHIPAIFNTQWVIRLDFAYDKIAIQSYWFSLVQRYIVLRMQFTFEASDAHCWFLDYEDCNAFFEISLPTQNKLDEFLRSQYDTPFSIDVRSPLWRAHLINSPESRYLALTIHHTIIDDRSIRLLLHELRKALNSNLHQDNRSKQVSDFTDYLDWLSLRKFASKETLWRSYTRNWSDVATLPGHELKPQNALEDARAICLVNRTLAAQIKQFAIDNYVTPNIVFLSAWTLILNRLCNCTTVSFGVVRAGYANSIQGAKKILGPLLKTLPFIKTVNSNCLTVDFLKEVQSNWQTLYNFDHCLMDQLNSWSSPRVATEAFTSIYNYIRGDLYQEFDTEDFYLIAAKRSRPLQPTLTVIESDGFSVDIVGPAGSKRFCAIAACALETVLKQMLSISKLKAIQLLPSTDADFMHNAYGPKVLLEDRSLKQLLERTLKQFANHPAIDGVEQSTFAELDQLSRKLIIDFHEYSLASDRPVAILLPPGKDCVTAILASIRFGVPFFCLNPQNEVHLKLKSAQVLKPSLIVTSKQIQKDLENIQYPVLLINSWEDYQINDSQSFGYDPEPSDIAYFVQTSGSTGSPKLIQIEHSSVVNLIHSIVPIYRLRPGDRRLQMAKPGVDFFIAEVLLTLCGGATLVILEQSNSVLAPRDFFAHLESYGITVSGVPSSYLNELMQELKCSDGKIWPPTLRLIVVGMESVDPKSVLDWEQLAPPNTELINVYGPSECTMIATTKSLRNAVSVDNPFIAIGRPIQNTCVYVLDDALQPLPDYVTGELCIAGLGVMRGYLSDTKKSGVIKNPLDERKNFVRLYRTGDYGYRLPNGDIVFQGRIDNQVKLRGHRVELGAIESCINRHPAVKASVLIVKEHNDQKQLVAFYLAKDEESQPLESLVLRAYLKERLPDYMVPSAFVQIEKISLTRNGKVDRKELEKREVIFESGQEYVAPNTATEKKLAAIWKELLKIEQLGIHDNFFDLGGHSLLAIQLVNRLRNTFEVELTLRDLFEFPTITQLAVHIDSMRDLVVDETGREQGIL